MTATASAAYAGEITRASKSNLALAFVSLPPDRRKDITTFYAWCRIIDDIADDPGESVEGRQTALNLWKDAIDAPLAGESALAEPIRDLITKYAIQRAHFLEIIAGVEMDLKEVSYATWSDLQLYCHRVASAVGLVSIEIFGYRNPGCIPYALNLGLALQLTNILRDVGQDFANGGRVYLPEEDMARFGFTHEDLEARRENDAFHALMNFEAERALGFYAAAEAALPREDRRSMIAAEIMRKVYARLLSKMRCDGFHVLKRRYSLSRWEKCLIVFGASLRARFF